VKDHINRHATLVHYEKVAESKGTVTSTQAEINGGAKASKTKVAKPAEEDGDGSELS
jgi:hypothetical protein